jgi:predicted enzyme related to lactoylglutathione lyase
VRLLEFPLVSPFLLPRFLLLAGLAFAATAAPADERYWPPIVDPPSGLSTPGKWVWADLVTHDVARAADFYATVLGWTFETYGGPNDTDTYTLALADGVPVAGMVFDARPGDGTPAASRWIGLISVPDVAAAVAAAKNGGGQVAMAPRRLGARGETAALVDPEGAVFGVVRSAAGDPADFLADVGEWLWIELWAAEPGPMAGFYEAVAGYEPAVPADAGSPLAFVLSRDGRARAGILPRPEGVRRTAWLPYVRVASVAEAMRRAEAAGALRVAGPFERGGATVAVIVDPVGAPLAIAEIATPPGGAP